MKCIYCGFDNPAQTKFCSHCGKLIEKTRPCPHCRKQIPAKSNFCPRCGEKLKGPSRKKRSRAERPASRRPSESKSSPSRIRDILIAAAIITVLGFGIAAILSSQKPRNTAQFRPSVPSSFVWPREVQSIASRFMCPCGQCELNLADCTCNNPRGAVEIKTFIDSLLKTATNREDIIKEVEAKYTPQI